MRVRGLIGRKEIEEAMRTEVGLSELLREREEEEEDGKASVYRGRTEVSSCGRWRVSRQGKENEIRRTTIPPSPESDDGRRSARLSRALKHREARPSAQMLGRQCRRKLGKGFIICPEIIIKLVITADSRLLTVQPTHTRARRRAHLSDQPANRGGRGSMDGIRDSVQKHFRPWTDTMSKQNAAAYSTTCLLAHCRDSTS
ncbi:hypothetical protein EDB84DRAFT_643088 [Lactarius hengduanensis]|nr:hypothetical protein EDB84DRAFT_643088 [Lactarius hengduanensis]